MTTKKKLLLLFVLTAISLTGIRGLWYGFLTPSAPVRAEKGVLDLRGHEWNGRLPVALDGEWELYPGRYIASESGSPSGSEAELRYIGVPGNWRAGIDPEGRDPRGYGSYRLRVLVDPLEEAELGLRMLGVSLASELFVNGRPVARSGTPAANESDFVPMNVPYTATFDANKGDTEIELVVQVAQFDRTDAGGILRPVTFGTAKAIDLQNGLSVGSQTIVCAVMALHALYVFLLYFMGIRQKGLLPFAFLTIGAMIVTFCDDDKLLRYLIPIGAPGLLKAEYASLTGVGLFLPMFVYRLLTDRKFPRALLAFFAVFAVGIPTILVAPYSFVAASSFYFFSLLLASLVLSIAMFARKAKQGDPETLYLLVGATAVLLNSLWGVVKNAYWPGLNYYPVDLIVVFLALAAYWFKRFFRTSEESRRLADRLRRADKQKDDFLANTSHELRNPLHGMLNIAQSVLEAKNSPLTRQDEQSLELLVSVGKRMSLLLNDLLDLNRLASGAIELRTAAVPLQPIATGVLDMLRFMTQGKPIRLENRIPDDLPPVAADENRLIQILFNLTQNAVKFTAEGTVAVRAGVRGETAWVSVEDTGIGLDSATMSRIFRRYEQGESAASSTSGGLGLGLDICRQLVELHGGTLEAESAPGRGSVFTFTLPLALRNASAGGAEDKSDAAGPEEAATDAAAAIATAEAAPALETGSPASGPIETISDRPVILAVDDDPVNLGVLKSMLPADRYELVTASGAKEALKMIGSREWDLVVSDVMMPGMSGYELTRDIRERYSASELPIVLLTARTRSEDIEAGFRAGATDYVAKPVDATELRARVRALTELTASIRERVRLEGAWLQAQIKPHFFLNALTAIASLSELDPNRMRALLEAFGDYLRACFDFGNANGLVTLERELSLVKAYLYIEKERFEDRLRAEWDVDGSLPADFSLPPLTIQTLVENAVRHGLMKRLSGGTVRISIRDVGTAAEISVSDDGVGIDPEALARIQRPLPDSGGGIGLRNTQRRLKQMYGEELRIESRPGRGTTVSYRVPLNR